MPFLLKLLACSQPLSIQSHPDRATAARLHAQNPAAYPDPNDKTEILIALEPFEAMAGFRNAVIAREDMARVTALAPWQASASTQAFPSTTRTEAWNMQARSQVPQPTQASGFARYETNRS